MLVKPTFASSVKVIVGWLTKRAATVKAFIKYKVSLPSSKFNIFQQSIEPHLQLSSVELW